MLHRIDAWKLDGDEHGGGALLGMGMHVGRARPRGRPE
ncbi:Hypothetical protein CAP_8945 [Chondromyces apiculatus DSM 436]|uniref:Uncharacterized protein n=1 Tax=Chondromyces apiculatus DSM 436 TaxID=1192034 RepID=A0A017SWZ6_9BACT|nr:Hypothetical protein CAP_8945 [Chondromyces apiculatus DSM 436]